MQVNMKAKCWDGMRTKELTKAQPVKVEKDILVMMEKKSNHYESMAITMAGIATFVGLSSMSNLYLPMSAFAAPVEAVPAMSSEAASKIMHVFDPLINLVVSLSYPIAGVMIAGGCLMIMVQQREAGMKMLQNAAIGYILVQLSPILLQLLVGIGSSV